MAALQFTPFADDPRLAEKAVRFPCFGVRNLAEAGKLSRVLSSQSLMSANNGKRVTISDAIMEEPRFSGGNFWYKEMQTARGREQNINGSRKLGEDAKPFEPPKDYIHIVARRGQATDNHSLAERVSKEHTFLREKISERMKLLQNLVPGCNKVAGKAIMLDEIINYVQCLQWQVEVRPLL
ncbi:hypothetical protein ZIOFF_044894 [Zingiber officinale]|uniref:BHLH domain-containing protein n=1 Tax=Zingiber officinale TaxID=94328 RepID=A0A8J5FY15_ZINOF|nr:hypothetical protein ZIOFF_044894 [Zingiber officinale]